MSEFKLGQKCIVKRRIKGFAGTLLYDVGDIVTIKMIKINPLPSIQGYQVYYEVEENPAQIFEGYLDDAAKYIHNKEFNNKLAKITEE